MSKPREDVFRLPPLTMAEAKVVNTLIQLNLMDDHDTTPELRKKIKALDTQITIALDFLGKRVNTDSDAVPGTVVEVMTAEEQYERDWEDTDDFDESKRGLMRLTVRWDGVSGEDGENYPPEIERGYSPEDLTVIEELPPRAKEVVLGFAKRRMGAGSEPELLNFQPHPENGWLFSMRDLNAPDRPAKLIQLTDNEASETGGLTTRDVTPRG